MFHDAYQYLENLYGLSNAGAVTLIPERSPGVKRMGELKETILESGAVCIFREPQFDSELIDFLIENAEIRVGFLDPLGADVEPGKDAYFQTMRNLVGALQECLQ